MTKKTHYIIIAFLFCFSSSLMGQFALDIVVKDQAKQLALYGVEVYNLESQLLKTSDQNGKVCFENQSTGIHYYTFFFDGYETLTDSVRINCDTTITIRINKLNLNLSAIDIIAEREALFTIRQLKDIEGTSIFAGKKTEVIMTELLRGNVANNNGRQVYAQVAGLNIYEGNDGGLQLNLGGRGLDPNRTSNFNTRQNGYDISADVLGYPENYYTPPTESLDEIRIIRGASSLQYGTQFGGLIDFITRKTPLHKKFEIVSSQTYGSFNSFNSFNAIGINKEKYSFNGFFNYKKGDGYRDNSVYDSQNLFLSNSFRFSDKTKVTAEFSYYNYLAQQAGGLTDQQFEENPQQSTRDRNWFDIDWKLYNVLFDHKLGEKNKLSLSIFGLNASRKSVGFRGNPINLNENPITSIDEKDNNGNYILPRDLIIGDFKNYGAEIRSLNKYNFASKECVLLLGAKYFNSNNTSIQGAGSINGDADFNLYNNVFPDYANQSNFKFPNLNYSFFAENIFYISDKFSLTPGIRFEHIKTESEGTYRQVIFDNAGNPIANKQLQDNNILKRNFVLLGMGLSYELNQNLKLIANLSQNYRSVTFSDIRVVSPSFIIDPEIKDEKGFTADIGIKGRKSKILSYDFTVFSVFYNDRIGIILDDRANRVRKNIGSAIIAGSESLLNINLMSLLSKNISNYKLAFFVNSAFSYSKYLSSEENNVVGKTVEFIPTINLKSGLEIGYKNFQLAYQFGYLSDQFTDVQNSAAATDGDIKSGIIGLIPSYQISDLTLTYKNSKLKFTGGINNVFNRAYFTRRATGYPGPGIIPSDGRSLFISAGIKI